MKTGFAAAWRIARPYWVSEDRWPARGLLALLIVIDLFKVYIAVRFTFWHRDFWDALAAFDAAAFWRLMGVFLVLGSTSVLLDTARPWFNQKLEMRWRHWVTEVYVQRWLSAKAYYHIDRTGVIDNPDQRVSEDLRMMASDTLTLFLGFIRNTANLVSYSIIVWGLSGSLLLHAWGVPVSIPGYLLWAAFVYAAFGTIMVEKIGRQMVRVDYRQQEREADFRFLLVRIRQSAEQIAFYSGEQSERSRLGIRFRAIRQNWRELMKYTKRVTLFNESYIEVGAIVAYVLILPRYFAREITLGMVQQAILSFTRVRGAFSWFIMQYKELALLRSVYRRLIEFDAALDHDYRGGLAVARTDMPGIDIHGLRLELPDATPLAFIAGIRIAAGERWMLTGRSGVGKSTLLRAMAGLWPHGSGRVEIPSGPMMFVPQRSYLPTGTLRECLCYPDGDSGFDDGLCRTALEDVRLGHLAERLDETADWMRLLSPGEQQRLAFARILLHRPEYLFLDEATSALDPDNEPHMYRLLLERLPGLTLVSVAHHRALRQFHTHSLELSEGGVRESAVDADADPVLPDPELAAAAP